MEGLIKKMKEEGLNTAVVEDWYKEMMDDLQQCYYLSQNGQPFIKTTEYENANRYYEKLVGFIWGIDTLEYIESEKCMSYIEGLIERFNF